MTTLLALGASIPLPGQDELDLTEEEEPTEQDLLVITVEESEYEDNSPNAELPDSIRLYLSEIGRIARLTPQEEISLAQIIEKPSLIAKELSEVQDPERRERLERMRERAMRRADEARERFISANLKLVAHFARNYVNRGVTFLDLVQEGNLGLIRAVEKFDWRAGFRFSTYATWWIQQALRRAMHTQERHIRLPVHANDDLANIIRAEAAIAQEKARPATELEVAARTGLPTKRIAHLKAITRIPVGINDRFDGEGDSTYADIIGDESHHEAVERTETTIVREALLDAIKKLDTREELVIFLRHGLVSGHPLTLAQTGEEVGVSREMARQLEIRAIKKLRGDPILVSLHILDGFKVSEV